MAKFKGGLYADLSNYNTSLPNTDILLNFFKSNPVGYRSGGMVQGIAGGNPTGMRVTGGFLANAQKFAQGTNPYLDADYLGKGEFAWEGAPLWSKERAKQELLDPEQPKLNISAYYQNPQNLLSLLQKKKGIWKRPDGKTVRFPPAEFDYSPEAMGSTKEGEEVPIWDRKARKFENNKWKKYSEKEKDAAKKYAVDDLLDQYHTEGEMYDVDPSGMLPSDKKEEQKLDEDKTVFQRRLEEHKDVGQTGQKFVHRPKKTYEDIIKEAEETVTGTDIGKVKKSTETNLVENVNKTPLAESDEMIDSLNTETTKTVNDAIAGIKSISFDDEKAINDIGKELYGEGKGKDAPAWAMPLMMAGLQMAASDNPSMLGAMGEGGIKGLEEYARMQKEKKQDAKDKVELELKKLDAKTQLKSAEFQKQTTIANMEIGLKEHGDNLEMKRIEYKQNNEQFYTSEANKQNQINRTFDLEYAKLDWSKLNDAKKFALEWQTAENQANFWNAQAKAYNKPDGKVHTVEIEGKKKYVWYGWDPSTDSFVMKPMETVEGIHYGPSTDDDLLSAFIKYTADSVISGTYTQQEINDAWNIFKGLDTDVGTLNKPSDQQTQ